MRLMDGVDGPHYNFSDFNLQSQLIEVLSNPRLFTRF